MPEPTLSAENKIRIDGLEVAIHQGFSQSDANDKTIMKKLDDMDKALFHDNGGECQQSRINQNTSCNKTIIGFLSAIGVVVLCTVARLLFTFLAVK